MNKKTVRNLVICVPIILGVTYVVKKYLQSFKKEENIKNLDEAVAKDNQFVGDCSEVERSYILLKTMPLSEHKKVI